MIVLLQMTDWSWWQLLICLLIPFLLGWLIGLMAKNKSGEINFSVSEEPVYDILSVKESERNKSDVLQRQKLNLETQLVECSKNNLALQRKIVELELELKMKSENLNEQPFESLAAIQEKEPTSLDLEPKTSMDIPLSQQRPSPVTENEEALPVDAQEELTIKQEAFQRLTEDRLQIIEGLGPKMEAFLQRLSVNTWTDLARQDSSWLKIKLEEMDPKYRILQTDSWPIQAAMARDGQWDELIQLQKVLSAEKSKEGTVITEAKVEKMLFKLGLLRKYAKDDLKAIEGIGPKIETILHNAGIWTWGQLAIFDVKGLNTILERAGERYQLADPTTWPKQAKMANDGKFKELIEYQKTLKGGIEKTG